MSEHQQDRIHPNASEFLDFTEKYAWINDLQLYYEYENGKRNENRQTSASDSSAKVSLIDYAILIVHGWTANRLRLHPLYIQLKQAGFPVFRLDLRGHGWSQKEGTMDFSLATMASDIDQFCRKVIQEEHGYQKIVLIAHSMGGSIAQLLAVSQPSYLQKLVLIGTSCNWTDKPFQKFLFQFYIHYYQNHFWEKYQKKKSGHAPLGLEHFPMWGHLYNTNGRTLFTSFHATIQGLQEMRKFDLRKQLPSIKIPTLIIVGDKDIDAPPRYAEKIHELLPNSRLEIIPEGNHDVVIGKAITVFQTISDFFTH